MLMTMTKTVWVFPGQGSQAVGMGSDLAEAAKDMFAEADEVLGWSVLERCQSSETPLADALYAQPCR